MKASPELMMPALITHNNLLQKAKYTNFGYTLEQEGDSYSIMFHEAADAVKFCLQVGLDSPRPTTRSNRSDQLSDRSRHRHFAHRPNYS